MRDSTEKFSHHAFVTANKKERKVLEKELGKYLTKELASCFGKNVSDDYRDARAKEAIDWLGSLGHCLTDSDWDTINQTWRYDRRASKKGGLVVSFWWEWDDDVDEKEEVEVTWHEFG